MSKNPYVGRKMVKIDGGKVFKIRLKVPDVGFLSLGAQTFSQSLVLHDLTQREGPKRTHSCSKAHILVQSVD